MNNNSNDNNNDNTLGFIILRHVNSKITNMYWQLCYKRIRKFYPYNKIVIIDDNSNYQYVTEIPLINTIIIKSEFPKRGELLPYLYYLKFKYFDTAVILHDSTFINKYINFSADKYKFLWNFDHRWDNPYNELRLLKVFNNPNLINFYKNKKLWTGCFGGMCIIKHEYLILVNNIFNLNLLVDKIITRNDRCSFERVIACILQFFYKSDILLGNINTYCKWGGGSRGIGLESWLWNNNVNPKNGSLKQIIKYKNLPIIKIWTGR